jgi:prefoldin alpha subunit
MAERLFHEERKKLESINKDLRNIESNIFDLEKTNFALKELNESKEKEMYINLGQGVFVKAKLEDTKKVNVMSPSKVLFTKTIEDVLKDFDKKRISLTNSQKKVRNLYVQTEKNVNQLYTFLNRQNQKKA